ncbi:MAG TPA: MFS transporter [Candidatus Dormibacteraeota bacterium]|nr:MFS transporter [Candidatus Dormibacteraeota bacterium]
MPVARNQTLPIYMAAGCIFAALAVRAFALPLRVNELGGDKVEIGLLFSVGTVTAAGLSLPAGFLADRFGKRALLLLSIVIGGVCQAGMGLAQSVPPLFFWQALAGVGAGAAQAALMSALVEVVPAPRLGRAMGWLTLAFQVGFLAGPAAAGAALQWLDLQTAIAISTVLFAVALALTLAGIPASPGRAVGWDLRGPLRQMAGRRAFAVAAVGMLGATMLWGTVQAYLPVFGKEHLGLAPTQIGYMVAIQAVANGLARIPGGRLVDRLRRRGLLAAIGLGVYAVAIAVLPHLTGFLATTLLLSLSVPILATVYIALGVLFTTLSTAETRGVVMGVYGMVLYLGLGFGPAVFGAVMEHAGYLAGFTAAAVAGLLLAALTALLRSDRVRLPRSAAAA